MRSASILAPAVALASIASAGAIPRADVDCNFATGWGCWTVKYVPLHICLKERKEKPRSSRLLIRTFRPESRE